MLLGRRLGQVELARQARLSTSDGIAVQRTLSGHLIETLLHIGESRLCGLHFAMGKQVEKLTGFRLDRRFAAAVTMSSIYVLSDSFLG